MILEVRINNYAAFYSDVGMSLEADMRSRKLSSNVHKLKNYNILKTVGIYGRNNVGKSCFVKAIKLIKDVMLNKPTNFRTNFNYPDNSICKLGVDFISSDMRYSYDFEYDCKEEKYIYEKFSVYSKDHFNNIKEKVLFLRDNIHSKYEFENEVELKSLLPFLSQNDILIYLLDTSKFLTLDQIKKIIVDFANNIEVVSMMNIPISKTISILKNHGGMEEKIVEFIKGADLYLDNFYYAKDLGVRIESQDEPDEDVLKKMPENLIDQIRLTSVYNGHEVPSLIFDSHGTKKIAALASYVIEALEQGKILVVDELDSGIHFKLTRSIVSMFNNEINTNSQLIFTVHDLMLMDCKKLFRKEQIYFFDKDEEGVFMYSLGDFTSSTDGIRGDTTDIIEKYKKGLLGAVPNPSFVKTLLNIDLKKRGDVNE